MKAGVDAITVSWGQNQSSPTGTDAEFKKVKVQLCFAPISQKQRAWRNTEEELLKDKTCQFLIVAKPYTAAEENFTWTIERNIPSATYFVRAYAFSSDDHEVAFGQSTDAKHTTNLFTIQAITGRHASIDICAGVFSAFSVVTLFVFFFLEKRKKALNMLLVQLIWLSSSCDAKLLGPTSTDMRFVLYNSQFNSFIRILARLCIRFRTH